MCVFSSERSACAKKEALGAFVEDRRVLIGTCSVGLLELRTLSKTAIRVAGEAERSPGAVSRGVASVAAAARCYSNEHFRAIGDREASGRRARRIEKNREESAPRFESAPPAKRRRGLSNALAAETFFGDGDGSSRKQLAPSQPHFITAQRSVTRQNNQRPG